MNSLISLPRIYVQVKGIHNNTNLLGDFLLSRKPRWVDYQNFSDLQAIILLRITRLFQEDHGGR